ncbi:MAG: transposase [Chloroflexi bacterium]|nr:transposase [Chloroflexota bacterium]
MLTLPVAIITLLEPFSVLFDARTWRKAQILLVGAVLAPGKRTVTSALRVMGLSKETSFAVYHHVLNRAVWSSLKVSRVLLSLLIGHLGTGDGPLVFGIDETLERRRGQRIRTKGIYRDAVRSSAGHFVKASGLRWISLMWLAPIPWAKRHWALPVLTVLAPSERYYQRLGKTPKKLTDWARQMIIQLRRWLPDRSLVIVGDSSYAVLDLLRFCQSLNHPVTFVTRLRLDAALHEPAPPRRPGQIGRPRLKGRRLPTLKQLLDEPTTCWMTLAVKWYDSTTRRLQIASDTAVWYNRGKGPVSIRWVLIRDPLGELKPQALLCTDLGVDPVQIIDWFVLRWQLEVTFQEVRTHLGVETQRQWSDRAIARTTPALFGLFSWVTLAAHALHINGTVPMRSAAWYVKSSPTFSDAIALVRRRLWTVSDTLCMSSAEPDILKVSRPTLLRLIDSLCYAA